MLTRIVVAGLFATSIASNALETSLFFPAAKKIPKGYSYDPSWKRACLERDQTGDFDLDGDGLIDTILVKKFTPKPGKVKDWHNLPWAKIGIKLSSTKLFIEIPAWLDYLDPSSGVYTTCGNGLGLKLVPDTCIKAGRYEFQHGVPYGGSSDDIHTVDYMEHEQFYYPTFAWMDSFSIANKTTEWVKEGATGGKLSRMQEMVKMGWKRYYSFDVEKNGVRIFSATNHARNCSDSTQSKSD